VQAGLLCNEAARLVTEMLAVLLSALVSVPCLAGSHVGFHSVQLKQRGVGSVTLGHRQCLEKKVLQEAMHVVPAITVLRVR
jgi:hypothetical protein